MEAVTIISRVDMQIANFFKYSLVLLAIFLLHCTSSYAEDEYSHDHIYNIIRDNLPYEDPTQITPIKTGFSSPGVYEFSSRNKKYVLRISHPKRSVSERQRTIYCYNMASELDLAPKIKYADAQQGLIISEYVDSKYISRDDLLDPKLLAKLAKSIKKLHTSKIKFPKSKNVFAVRKSFEKTAKQLNSQIIESACKHLSSIDKILENNSNLVSPTHNDLKPENILYNGNTFKFVDWEAANHTNPYFDLATIIIFYNLSADQENIFLLNYFGKYLKKEQLVKLSLFKQEVMGYYGMAYLMLSTYKKLPRLSQKEIMSLPKLDLYLETKFSNKSTLDTYSEAQKFGWILIKELVTILTLNSFQTLLSH